MYTKKNGRMTFKSHRRPNFKRNNNYGSKSRNKGNVTQQYNKYLKLAKDTFSSGDRVQAEYYYQFTDHYYRLMLELGINIEDQDNTQESKVDDIKTASIDINVEAKEADQEKLEVADDAKDEEDQSIESVPFISEPVKKKRTKTLK